MPSWGAVIWGVAASAALAAIAAAVLLRERRPTVLGGIAVAAGLGPLLWDLVLRHTGGDFFVDAPVVVFPVSFEDAGSGVFATALGALLLGFGPIGAGGARRLATASLLCGVAALVVDVYLY